MINELYDEEKLSKIDKITITEQEYHHSDECESICLLDENILDKYKNKLNVHLYQNISYDGKFCGAGLTLSEYGMGHTSGVNPKMLRELSEKLEIAANRLDMLISKPIEVLQEK